MSLTPEEHDYIGQVIAEDAAERAPRNRRVTVEPAPVPPAGDVEVLGYLVSCYSTRLSKSPGGSDDETIELVDRAHVTRLTAERDKQRKLKMLLAERLTNAEANCSVYRVQRDELTAERDGLQSELAKARELLTKGSHYGPHPWNQQVMDFLAHQSAPAAKGERYECIGKGGDYQVVAIAQGAGTLKGFNHYVYKNADGVHFVRDPEDFLLRMQVKP